MWTIHCREVGQKLIQYVDRSEDEGAMEHLAAVLVQLNPAFVFWVDHVFMPENEYKENRVTDGELEWGDF